jgi:hypothetical protein
MLSLLPFIIGSALVPVQIIVVVLLLTGEKRGPLKAITFVIGMTLARLVQGVLFGFFLTGGTYDPADAAANSDWIKATAMVIVGLMLLITAYKNGIRIPIRMSRRPSGWRYSATSHLCAHYFSGRGLY